MYRFECGEVRRKVFECVDVCGGKSVGKVLFECIDAGVGKSVEKYLSV